MSKIVKSEENHYAVPRPGLDSPWIEWIGYILYLYLYGAPKSPTLMVADLIKDLAEILGWEETHFEVTRFFSCSIIKWPTDLMLTDDNMPTNILPVNSEKKEALDNAIQKLHNYPMENIARAKTYRGSFVNWKNDWQIKTRAIIPTEEYLFSSEIKFDYSYNMKNGNKGYEMTPGLKFIVTMHQNKNIQLRVYYHAQGIGESATAYSVCCVPKTRLYLTIRAGNQVTASDDRKDLESHDTHQGKCEIFWTEAYSQINYIINFDASHYDQSADSDGITGYWSDYTEIANVTTIWATGFDHFTENNEDLYFDFSSAINYYRKIVDAQ